MLILSAGGHGKVVADSCLCHNRQAAEFLDDDPLKWGTSWFGLPVSGRIDSYVAYASDGLMLGIGSIAERQQVVERLGRRVEHLWRRTIHPARSLLSRY